jgi:carbonic anhydrase/acetyltransferase-like protein (isoleucine patch superfamily)
MIFEYNQTVPTIGKRVYIAPTAVLIGDVSIGDGASIWFNAVLRGDMAPIVIGANSNIQDNCTIHTDTDMPVQIGDYVTVGHNAIIHGCTIDSGCLIGIGAIVLNGAHVEAQSLVAAGAVVREGTHVGPRQLVAGSPAVVKRELSGEMLDRIEQAPDDYLKLAAAYLQQRI